jgi:Asp-tRNA(Asn)/Glu-tRNA(Gln) amidotransferase A subunit family amidase
LRGSKTVNPDQPWEVDAPVTARLREAGAVLLGKTTTPNWQTMRHQYSIEAAMKKTCLLAWSLQLRGSQNDLE